MRKLRLLLLPLGLLQGLLSQTIHVSQIPVISVVKSSSVTLPCDYTINSAQEGTIGSYKWYKHSVKPAMEISNSKNEFIGRISRANTDRFIKEQSAAITLHRVGFSDSGMYYCEVSFQIGRDINVCGDGTFLNVTGSGDDPCPVNDSNCSCYDVSKRKHMICILLKSVGIAVILLIALTGYLCNKIGDCQNQDLRTRTSEPGPHHVTDPTVETVHLSRCDLSIIRPPELNRNCPQRL